MLILMTLATMEKAIERSYARRVKVSWLGDDRCSVKCDNPEHAPHVVRFVERHGTLYAECDCMAHLTRRPCYHMAHAYYQRLHALEVLSAKVASVTPMSKRMDSAMLHTGGLRSFAKLPEKIRGIRI
jgi:hypothetical protein